MCVFYSQLNVSWKPGLPREPQEGLALMGEAGLLGFLLPDTPGPASTGALLGGKTVFTYFFLMVIEVKLLL